MTQWCFSLPEAAERLGLSETVLVRLSQYFKVPEAAYEAQGFLSFKGELTFDAVDLDFFATVQKHLIAGASLEAIQAQHLPPYRAKKQRMPQPPPLQEVVDTAPYEAAAAQSLTRYKNASHPAPSGLFKRLLTTLPLPTTTTAINRPVPRPIAASVPPALPEATSSPPRRPPSPASAAETFSWTHWRGEGVTPVATLPPEWRHAAQAVRAKLLGDAKDV